MRKFVCLVLGSAVAVSALGLAACHKPSPSRCRYTIEAEYTAATRTLAAQMQVVVPNTSNVPLSELKFQLWANAYREGAKYAPVSELFSRAAYYGGKSYGETEIKGVSGVESFSVGGEDDNILTLRLRSPLEPGDSVSVGVDFDVELANINHRLGVAQNAVNLANFYPVLCFLADDGFREYVYSSNGDPFVNGLADYDVTLTVPQAYTLVSGFAADELADVNADDGKKTYHVLAEGVRDVAFSMGEGFQKITDKLGDIALSYYYIWDKTPEATLAVAKESLAYYAENFGAYAYPAYTVVETDFVYGGMEYPALSMISTSLQESEVPAVVAHETAHQWWYSMVGSNQFECAWQDEGLAEYSAALFFGAHPDYGVGYSDCVAASESSYRAYFSVYSQVHGEANTVMNRPLTAYAGDYEYRNIAYDKGVILFDRVREVVGEKKFMNALKRYAKTYTGAIATSDDLISCFTRAGANAAALFDSFLSGKCVI